MASDSHRPLVNQSKKRPAEFRGSIAPAKRKLVQPAIEGDELCHRCNSIPWTLLAREAPISRNGKLIARLSISQEKLRRSRCPVCRLIASVKPRAFDLKACQLKACSFGGVPKVD